jgi:hypothetical protein
MATAPKKAGCLEGLAGLVFLASLLAFPIFLIILIVNLFSTAASSHHPSFDVNASSIALIGAPGKTVAFNLTGQTLDTESGLGDLSGPLWASDTGVSLELSNRAGFDQIFSLVGIVPENWGDSIGCVADCRVDFTINLKFTLPSSLAESPVRILTGHITGDIITPQPISDGFQNNQKQLDIPVSLKLRTVSVSGHRQAIETSLAGTLISFGVAVAYLIAELKVKTRRPARKARIKKERQPRKKANASAQPRASNPPAPGSSRPLPEPGALLSCSFCGNHQKLVRKLIAGPGVYICDVCVGRVRSVIAGQGDGLATTPIATIQQVSAEARETRCSFCGKRRHQVTAMASTGDTRIICDECLGLCEEILREELPGVGDKGPPLTAGTATQGITTMLEVCSRRRERMRSLKDDPSFNRAVEELKREGPEGAKALAALVDELLAARCAEILDVLAAASLLSPQPDLIASVQRIMSASAVIVGQPGRFPPVIIGGDSIGWDDGTAARIREQASEVLTTLSTAAEATAPLASAPQPTQATSPVGFQTFTNSDNSFTITYPGDWQQQAASPGNGSQFTSQDQQKVFYIAAGDPGTSHADPATAVSTACSNAGGTPSQPQTVSINGQPWTKVECDLPDESTHMIVLATDYKGRLFVIAYGSPKASFDSDASQFFNPMEQSFQFLE